MTVRIFVSYCHLDDAHRVEIDKHLAPMRRRKDIEIWFDGDIHPGQNVGRKIALALKEADVVVALASHNYLNSLYCFKKEYSPSLRRMKRGELHLVVAMVGTCDWKHTEMANYKILPKDAKPVDSYGNRNKAYVEIVDGIRAVVGLVKRARRAAGTAKLIEPKTSLPKAKPSKPVAAMQVSTPKRVPASKPADAPSGAASAKKKTLARTRTFAADVPRPASPIARASKVRPPRTTSAAKQRDTRKS